VVISNYFSISYYGKQNRISMLFIQLMKSHLHRFSFSISFISR